MKLSECFKLWCSKITVQEWMKVPFAIRTGQNGPTPQWEMVSNFSHLMLVRTVEVSMLHQKIMLCDILWCKSWNLGLFPAFCEKPCCLRAWTAEILVNALAAQVSSRSGGQWHQTEPPDRNSGALDGGAAAFRAKGCWGRLSVREGAASGGWCRGTKMLWMTWMTVCQCPWNP